MSGAGCKAAGEEGLQETMTEKGQIRRSWEEGLARGKEGGQKRAQAVEPESGSREGTGLIWRMRFMGTEEATESQGVPVREQSQVTIKGIH